MSLLHSHTDYSASVQLLCSAVNMASVRLLYDCDFQLLLVDILNLTVNIALSRYLANICDINTAIMAIANCQGNFGWCGYNVGVVIKVFTTWGF